MMESCINNRINQLRDFFNFNQNNTISDYLIAGLETCHNSYLVHKNHFATVIPKNHVSLRQVLPGWEMISDMHITYRRIIKKLPFPFKGTGHCW